MSKPQTFKIKIGAMGRLLWPPNSPEHVVYESEIEVVEYSAYEAAMKRVEELELNYAIRTKELDDLNNSLPETHWAYWRKRAGEMTSAWSDRGEEIKRLESQNKKLIEALELIAGPVEFYCEVGERNKQVCAQAVLEEINK